MIHANESIIVSIRKKMSRTICSHFRQCLVSWKSLGKQSQQVSSRTTDTFDHKIEAHINLEYPKIGVEQILVIPNYGHSGSVTNSLTRKSLRNPNTVIQTLSKI